MKRGPYCIAGAALALLIAPACARRPAPGTAEAGAAPAGATPGAAVAVAEALPFIADDGPRALAEAKRRGVPVFVEAWAPW
jgi:hypothetical protein